MQAIILLVILIFLNAVFASAEIAVLSMSETKLRKLVEEGDKRALKLNSLVEQPARFLATIQVAITLAGFLQSAFAADTFADPLAASLVEAGVPVPESVLRSAAIVLITIILSYFTLVFGELVPKRLAMKKSEQMALGMSGILYLVAKVFAPLVWLLTVSTNLVLRLMGISPEEEEDQVTEEEIRMMIDLGGQKGTIDQEEQEWIENVFRFDDISVREAMTRTADVEAFSLDATDEEIIHTIRETGLSRYPVYNEDINDIVGILNARDFLLERGAEHPRSLKELLRNAYFVPESIHADDLFQDMQTKKVHIAVVIDEYGQTAGIITIEDLLEEIVGNIYDEFDPAEKPEMEKLEENLWRVNGGVFIGDLAEELEMDIPEDEDYDTLGGMIFSCLHTIPADGSQFDVQVNGLDIHVEKIEDRRIEEALIRKLPPAEPEEDGDDSEQDRKDQNKKEKSA